MFVASTTFGAWPAMSSTLSSSMRLRTDEHRAFLNQQIGQPGSATRYRLRNCRQASRITGQSVRARSPGWMQNRFVILCPDGHHRFEIGARQAS